MDSYSVSVYVIEGSTCRGYSISFGFVWVYLQAANENYERVVCTEKGDRKGS